MRNDSETHETDTGLHGLRSRECHPVTPVECVSLSFCTHPCLLAFTIYIVCTKGIEMALVTRIEYVLWCRTLHQWVMNIHYQTWIPLNMIRTPLKQWGMCDNLSMLTCKPDPCRDSPAYNTKTFGFLPGWAMGCSIWVFYIRYTR